MKNFILLIPRLFYFFYQIFIGLFNPNIPYKVKLVILGAMFYVISPIDFFNDLKFFPLGLIDDFFVLGITALIYKYFSFISILKKNFQQNENKEKIIDGEFRTIEEEEEKNK